MQILGYVGYAILIFFAVTWTLGVRAKLEAGLFAVMGALFYSVTAILLAVHCCLKDRNAAQADIPLTTNLSARQMALIG